MVGPASGERSSTMVVGGSEPSVAVSSIGPPRVQTSFVGLVNTIV